MWCVEHASAIVLGSISEHLHEVLRVCVCQCVCVCQIPDIGRLCRDARGWLSERPIRGSDA